MVWMAKNIVEKAKSSSHLLTIKVQVQIGFFLSFVYTLT